MDHLCRERAQCRKRGGAARQRCQAATLRLEELPGQVWSCRKVKVRSALSRTGDSARHWHWFQKGLEVLL